MLTYDKTAMATYPRCVHKIIMPQKTLNQTAKIFSQDVKKHTTTTTTTKLVPTQVYVLLCHFYFILPYRLGPTTNPKNN